MEGVEPSVGGWTEPSSVELPDRLARRDAVLMRLELTRSGVRRRGESSVRRYSLVARSTR